MKINFNYKKTMPKEAILCLKPIYDDEIPVEQPEIIKNTMQQKQKQNVREIVYESENISRRMIIVRFGNKPDSSQKKREESASKVLEKLYESNEDILYFDIRDLGNDGLDLLFGLLAKNYRFDKYRTEKSDETKLSIQTITIVSDNPEKTKTLFAQKQAELEGIFYARDLTSEPPNCLPPVAYAEKIKELESLGISVEILNREKMEKLGMTAILAVAKGSSSPPAVVILQYNPENKTSKPIALVGKGVCFDSGGLCLKAVERQFDMKWDKAGAGVVVGVIKAMATEKIPVNVVGIIGLVENMPDGAAAKPGDVIKTMSGKTVEIVNTDAEGRLVLADCLQYIQKNFHPEILIDLGTLTVETIASLGCRYAGAYGNNRKLLNELKEAGEQSGEEIWELPMGEYYARQIQSSVADIKNVGEDFCGENGAAAEFLKCFVDQTIPWVHLDIAGVSWTKEDLPLANKGVTGFGVRILYKYLINNVLR